MLSLVETHSKQQNGRQVGNVGFALCLSIEESGWGVGLLPFGDGLMTVAWCGRVVRVLAGG